MSSQPRIHRKIRLGIRVEARVPARGIQGVGEGCGQPLCIGLLGLEVQQRPIPRPGQPSRWVSGAQKEVRRTRDGDDQRGEGWKGLQRLRPLVAFALGPLGGPGCRAQPKTVVNTVTVTFLGTFQQTILCVLVLTLACALARQRTGPLA